jgi:NTP pyrophosphatase (non-canonical NTP hydrolase)
MNIFQTVKELCDTNGLSVPKLEKELGFGSGTIYNWKKSSPSFDNVQKVFQYFGRDVVLKQPDAPIDLDADAADPAGLRAAIDAVITERARQNTKWGEQNHGAIYWLGILGEEFGELCQAINETVFDNGPTERAKGGYANMRREAVQVAAVAVAFVELLDRRYGEDKQR